MISTLYFALKNICMTAALKLYECALFWNRPWWWALNYHTFLLYLRETRSCIVSRERESRSPYSEDNFTPGETSLVTLMKIFNPVQGDEALPFIDLGSGRGYAVFGASLLFNCPAEGIELLPSYVKKCETIRKKLGIGTVRFIEGDLLSLEVNRRGIYYCAATALDLELRKSLEVRLEEAPPGSWVIMVHHPLSRPFFKLAYCGSELLPFSHGWDSVHYYRVEKPL